MIFSHKKKHTSERGIAIYIAVTITAALILVSISILNIALKQISISGVGRDSQNAFYAADSGIDCALFWDLKNPSRPESAFDPASPNDPIRCNNIQLVIDRVGSISTFTMTYVSPELYCARVSVNKSVPNKTTIESRGYNTCDVASNRRLERALRVSY